MSPNPAANTKFIHTADWQLGKPFAGVRDPQKRAHLQNERFNSIRRIAELVKQRDAQFVLVAGDAFDSPTATKATVSAACSAIGAIGVPVFIVPGNHDHGGEGSLWTQDFFKRESSKLSPNLRILTKEEPVEFGEVVLLPCPLGRRHESHDPTQWLRVLSDPYEQFGERPRIVIAHGSVHDFGSSPDDEDDSTNTANLLDLSRLPDDEIDYIALGDWHGTKEVGLKAWYSGTPELDRFGKGEAHDPGNSLVVQVARGRTPQIEVARTGEFGWHDLEFTFSGDGSLNMLESRVSEKIGTRANRDLLHLKLDGTLGIEAATRLDELLESWESRLIRLKLQNQTTLAPNSEEIGGLVERASDPLLASVSSRLVSLSAGSDEEAEIARVALRELYACSVFR